MPLRGVILTDHHFVTSFEYGCKCHVFILINLGQFVRAIAFKSV